MRLHNYILGEEMKGDEAGFLWETSSCIGIVASPSTKEFLKTVKVDKGHLDVNQIVEILLAELKKPGDWSPVGVNYMKKRLADPEKNRAYILDMADCAAGMAEFMDDEVLKNIKTPYFVHGSIVKYYEVEAKTIGTRHDSKDNTADVIICSVPPERLFEDMTKFKPGAKGKYCTCGFTKFYQVSLKKSEAAAQLGKSNRFLMVKGIKDRSLLNPVNKALDEGVTDIIKNAFNTISDKIHNVIRGFRTIVDNFMKKRIQPESLKEIGDIVGYNGPITEGMCGKFSYAIDRVDEFTFQKAMNPNEKALLDKIIKNCDKLLKAINDKIDEAVMLSKKTEGIVSSVQTMHGIKTPNENAALKLVANYDAIRTIINIANQSKNISKLMAEMIADTFFGATKLPLWKVFSATNPRGSYRYMGTFEDFVKTHGEAPPSVELLCFRVTPSNDYYIIGVAALEGVDDGMKKYVIFRTGTSGTRNFSSTFEGKMEKSVPLGTSPLDMLAVGNFR